MSLFSAIEEAVHELKIERDTWRAVALQYKEALKTQSSRLQELHDIHMAAKAECNKPRMQDDGPMARPHSSRSLLPGAASELDSIDRQSFGTATIFSPPKGNTHSSQHSPHNLLKQTRELLSQRNYGLAQIELDRLLQGSLSPEARVEGLLLKSDIWRTLGPDELYNALAACSEALELCDRLPELTPFVSRLQYQRGIIFCQLRMLSQAQEAFRAIGQDDVLYPKASEYRRSCKEELHSLHVAKRRPGFDESRDAPESCLAQLDDRSDSRRRRTSMQLRRAASRAKRLALPQRRKTSKSS